MVRTVSALRIHPCGWTQAPKNNVETWSRSLVVHWYFDYFVY